MKYDLILILYINPVYDMIYLAIYHLTCTIYLMGKYMIKNDPIKSDYDNSLTI